MLFLFGYNDDEDWFKNVVIWIIYQIYRDKTMIISKIRVLDTYVVIYEEFSDITIINDEWHISDMFLVNLSILDSSME